MNKNRFAAFVAGTALAALTVVGCNTTTPTNNAVVNTNTNTNVNTATSNTAVVVNNNGNMNTSGVSTMNGNYNANMTRADYDREKDRYDSAARSSGRTIGSGANDSWLWTKTRAALATTDDLRDSTVNVDVDNAVVTLTGTVGSQAQKGRAGSVAQGIDGVKSVKNNLQVSAGGNMNANGNMNGNMNRNANGNMNGNTNRRG